jgi:hypothetical protein
MPAAVHVWQAPEQSLRVQQLVLGMHVPLHDFWSGGQT